MWLSEMRAVITLGQRVAAFLCPPNRGILADVIVYIFAHLYRALPTEGKVLDIH